MLTMNLARIKFMAFMLHTLCVVQTVSLHKLAAALPTSVERESNLRRIQRFIARYAFNLELVARMIYSLLPVKTGLVLSMDRTNWKFGDFNINILMLGVTYKGIVFPLMFSLLPKRGNSNWEERKALVERFIRLFGSGCIDCLVADREFIGKDWISRLNRNHNTVLYPNPAGLLGCQAFHRGKNPCIVALQFPESGAREVLSQTLPTQG